MTPESQAGDSSQDSVYQRLRHAILTLQLLPGERIAERTLEGMLGSSRTPIREALQRLVAEGLVLRQARSHRVAPIDLGELLEVCEYREYIESAIVRLACERATPEALAEIQEVLDIALKSDGQELWFSIGADVHLQLANLSGNRFLICAMEDIMTRVARARWIMASMPENRATAHAEHSEILRLIGARRTDEAVAAVVEHTRFVRDNLAEALRQTRLSLRANGFDVVESLSTGSETNDADD